MTKRKLKRKLRKLRKLADEQHDRISDISAQALEAGHAADLARRLAQAIDMGEIKAGDEVHAHGCLCVVQDMTAHGSGGDVDSFEMTLAVAADVDEERVAQRIAADQGGQ